MSLGVFSAVTPKQIFDHTHHSQMAFLQSETAGEIWGFGPVSNLYYTNGMGKASDLCEFLCDASDVL